MKYKEGDLVIILDPRTISTFKYRSQYGDYYDDSVKDAFTDAMFNTVGILKIIDYVCPNRTIHFEDISYHYYAHWISKVALLDRYLLTGEKLCNN